MVEMAGYLGTELGEGMQSHGLEKFKGGSRVLSAERRLRYRASLQASRHFDLLIDTTFSHLPHFPWT